VTSDEFYDELFEELYQAATPGLDELEDFEYSGDVPVNRLHYLDGDRQLQIIEEYCNQYDVPLSDRRQVRFNVVLGKGPSTSLSNVNRARETEGLETIEEPLEGDTQSG
jgi:hypothetical protein